MPEGEDGRSRLEEDLAIWLSSADPATVFAGLPDGPRRCERAGRVIAWLQANHEPLRAAGLVAFGEKPTDVRLSPELAAELLATLR